MSVSSSSAKGHQTRCPQQDSLETGAKDVHRVLYVLSTGRSGSTLLEMLLASSDDTWTMGEVHLLPFELGEGRHTCGCGEITTKCPFWAPILDELRFKQDDVRLTEFREAHNLGKTWRPTHLLSMMTGGKQRYSRRAKAYGNINADLFGKVAERAASMTGTAPSWLVDASKDPYRLNWLLRDPRFDVRVIHLTRSAHGFVNSSLNRDRYRSTITKAIETARLALRWTSANLIFSLVCSIVPEGRTTRIRYEDLASDPDRTVREACAKIGLALESEAKHFQTQTNHGIAGNQMRTRKTGVVLDEKWRKEMSLFEKIIVSMISTLPSGAFMPRSRVREKAVQ